jgi:hypothetical protein
MENNLEQEISELGFEFIENYKKYMSDRKEFFKEN